MVKDGDVKTVPAQHQAAKQRRVPRVDLDAASVVLNRLLHLAAAARRSDGDLRGRGLLALDQGEMRHHRDRPRARVSRLLDRRTLLSGRDGVMRPYCDAFTRHR